MSHLPAGQRLAKFSIVIHWWWTDCPASHRSRARGTLIERWCHPLLSTHLRKFGPRCMSEFASLVLGFFSGVIAKVISDVISHRLLGPCLTVEFKQSELFVVPTEAKSENGIKVADQVYVRVRVTNGGRRSALNCRCFLIRVERLDAMNNFVPVPGGEECLQLIWSNAVGANRTAGFDLAPGVSRFVDVIATSNNNGAWLPQAVPSSEGGLPNLPVRLHPELCQSGQYRLQVQATAESAEPVLIALTFNWGRGWNDLDVQKDPMVGSLGTCN